MSRSAIGGELGLLGAEADVVPGAVGEQVCRGAIDELIALLGDLREEVGYDALAHHATGHGHLLEEDVLDPLVLDAAGDLLDALAPARGVACLLERRGRQRRSGRLEDRADGSAEGRGGPVDGDAVTHASTSESWIAWAGAGCPARGDYITALSKFVQIRPRSAARRATSRRLPASSFVSTADTWCSAVRGETTSRSAISAFESPSESSVSTSSWRGVRPAGLARVERRGPAGRAIRARACAR